MHFHLPWFAERHYCEKTKALKTQKGQFEHFIARPWSMRKYFQISKLRTVFITMILLCIRSIRVILSVISPKPVSRLISCLNPPVSWLRDCNRDSWCTLDFIMVSAAVIGPLFLLLSIVSNTLQDAQVGWFEKHIENLYLDILWRKRRRSNTSKRRGKDRK